MRNNRTTRMLCATAIIHNTKAEKLDIKRMTSAVLCGMERERLVIGIMCLTTVYEMTLTVTPEQILN